MVTKNLKQSSPTRKVTAATGGAAVGTGITHIILWLLDDFIYDGKKQIVPERLEDGLWILVPALTTFVAGYFTKSSTDEVVV